MFLHAGALILAATASARAVTPAALVEYGVELWEQPAPLAEPAPAPRAALDPTTARPAAVAPAPVSRPVTAPANVPALPEPPAPLAVPAPHQPQAAEPAPVATDDVEPRGSSDGTPAAPRATTAAGLGAPQAASAREPAAIVPKATPRAASGAERQRIAGLLHRRVDSLKRYPAIARRAGWQGVVQLEVTVAPDGRLLGRRIRKSSGVPVLDSDALALIDRASPLRLGDTNPASPITAVIPVSYVLSN